MTTVLFLSQNSGTGTLTTLITGFAWTVVSGNNRIARVHLSAADLSGLAAALPATAQARLYRERNGVSRDAEYEAAATAYYASPVQGIITDEVYS